MTTPERLRELADELPPLPEPTVKGTAYHPELKICYSSLVNYKADDMRAYASAAIAHHEAHVAARPAVTVVDERIAALSDPIDPTDYYGPMDAIARAIEWMQLDDDNRDPKVCRRLRMALTDVASLTPPQTAPALESTRKDQP